MPTNRGMPICRKTHDAGLQESSPRCESPNKLYSSSPPKTAERVAIRRPYDREAAPPSADLKEVCTGMPPPGNSGHCPAHEDTAADQRLGPVRLLAIERAASTHFRMHVRRHQGGFVARGSSFREEKAFLPPRHQEQQERIRGGSSKEPSFCFFTPSLFACLPWCPWCLGGQEKSLFKCVKSPNLEGLRNIRRQKAPSEETPFGELRAYTRVLRG